MNKKGLSLWNKLHPERYFSAWLVLGLDVAVSVCSSLTGLLFYGLLIGRSPGAAFSFWWLTCAITVSVTMFLGLRTYRAIIRHSTLHEIGKLGLAVTGKALLLSILLYVLAPEQGVATAWLPFMDFTLTFGALVLLRIAMIVVYDLLRGSMKARQPEHRILIYGTGDKSVASVVRLQNSGHYRVMGFLTYGKRQKGYTLAGYRVSYFETEKDLSILRDRYGIDGILFSYYTDAQAEQERLLCYCTKCGLKTLIAPSIDRICDGQIPRPVRKIRIEDLLDRPEIEISMSEIASNFKGKTILVTGAAGSIGSEVCRQLTRFGIRELVMFDNAETPLHNLSLEFEDKHGDLRFTPVIGDVRFPERLDYVFRNYRPNIVFHAAAYKHVPMMEDNPCEAVLVNVAGTRNVADKCIAYGVEKMVMVSTDKAVNPTNIMGCTKRLAEIYVQSIGLAVAAGKTEGRTRFVTTRFGNVLGSNGSVVPHFKEQIERGGPVTVTHPEITRFFMTIPEACRLVMEAATISSGNEICVFDMGKPVKIAQLAKLMIRLYNQEVGKDIRIEYTGLRPGEKLYEEVLSTAENTQPTIHDKIRIAKVREHEYDDVRKAVGELEALCREVDIPGTVRMMKRLVPEFKSENSRFKEFDAANKATGTNG